MELEQGGKVTRLFHWRFRGRIGLHRPANALLLKEEVSSFGCGRLWKDAAGLALVSTRVGVEGLPVSHGEHALLAETPEETAAAILGLMRDSDTRHRLQRTARRWVEQEFSWESAASQFFQLCQRVVS